MQRALAAMLIDAFHAAFENAVIALNRVCVHVATDIFIGLMADALMAREMIT